MINYCITQSKVTQVQITTMDDKFSIAETFKKRRSERSYQGVLSDEEMELVKEIVEECNFMQAPYKTPAKIDLTEPGIGRLGVIKNESGWIVLKIPEHITDKDEFTKYTLDAAYRASIAVLKMVQCHIGTVWVTGSFQHAEAEKRFPGFKIQCAIAYGKVASSLRFFDKAIKFFVSNSRLNFEEIFYDEKLNEPLKQTDEGRLMEFLDCLRWLPSMGNKQSWRVSYNSDGNRFKIFDAINAPNNETTYDMGIMISGFSFYSEGNCIIDMTPSDETFPTGGKYICSIIMPKMYLE